MQGVVILSYAGMFGACIILLIGLLRLAWINSHNRDGWRMRKRKNFWEEDREV